MKKEGSLHKSKHHPIFREKLTLGQRWSDVLTNFGGSWLFIISLGVYLVVWIGLNMLLLTREPFDPYPFILLNLTLSCLAAVQGPIILMAHGRQEERDRVNAKYDYVVNRKAEREIKDVKKELDIIKKMLSRR